MKGTRRPVRRRIAVSGATVAGLSALTALTVAATRNRYYTGEGRVVQLLEATDGGLIVVLDNKVFWAPPEERELVKSYEGSATRRLPFRIERLQRRRSDGLLVGRVNTRA